MRYFENRSQVWFKILDAQGQSVDQEQQAWQLPKGVSKSAWIISTTPIGTLLVSNPKEFLLPGFRAFVAELKAGELPVIEHPGCIWVRELRLVREATNLDLKRFGIYRALVQQV